MTFYVNKRKPSLAAYRDVIRFIFLWGPFLVFVQTGCKKFVQVDPPTIAITSAVVYTNDLSAAAAVTSIYDNMMSNFNGLSQGYQSISCLAGLTADEFENYSPIAALAQCYTNTLSSANNYFWPEIYQEIHVANAVLEGLSNSSGVTSAEKQQLIGEALFMRAFLHFYGTNIYGDIPLVTTTNYLVNNTIQRSPQSQIFQQVIADLKNAQSSLSNNFLTPTGGIPTTERVRPNKGAATALLARAYLYIGAWDSAEAQSTSVINNTATYGLVMNLDSVFLMNSMEAIWQMQPVYPGYNTFDAYNFVLASPPGHGNNPVALTPNLVYAFEVGDQRRVNWVDSLTSAGQTYYYPYKYKVSAYNQAVTEYLMVLRLAEQFLIRAEARAQQGNLSGAAADLNIIRMRAGLGATAAATKQDLLNAIYHERQVELFTEWGHRWFDLKRTGNIDLVMSIVTPEKGGSWSPDWALFPIPQSEISLNPNLTQNTGYSN